MQQKFALHRCICLAKSIFRGWLSFDGSAGKGSACNVGDTGSISGLGRSPGKGNGTSLQYSCLKKSHGQRSLAGYSPGGQKESNTTEWLSRHIISSLNTIIFFLPLLLISDLLFLFSFQMLPSRTYGFFQKAFIASLLHFWHIPGTGEEAVMTKR